MGLTAIFLAMFKPLLWLVPFLLFGAFLKSPWFKGWLGERRVRMLIDRRLDLTVYREFQNVTIRRPDGETTQIDHIYVSPFGIFVIETKNMSHWIFGNATRPTWTQQIYRTKVPFRNPLHQNYGHIKALEALLEIPEHMFKSIVVFAGDSTFKTAMPDEVHTCDDLIGYIRSIDIPILSPEQIDAVCWKLHSWRLEPSWSVHRAHVDSLRRRHGEPGLVRTTNERATMAEGIVDAVAERLVRAAEDRIRGGGRRHVFRGMQLGLSIVVAKGLLAIAAMAMIWWAFTTVLGNAGRAVSRIPVTAVASPVTRAPVQVVERPAPPGVEPNYATQPVAQPPTPEEIEQSQRDADEAMRVLAPNTPEVPLTLP
jgi:restriction system protein